MREKRFGRMSVRAWLNLEMERTSPAPMVIFGLLAAACGIAVRLAVGSPYYMTAAMGIGEIVPPAWLTSLLWTAAFFTVGCGFGYIVGFRAGGREAEKYKCGMLFVLLAVAELCWYPTFFCLGWVFVSVLETVLILCLSVALTVTTARVSRFPALLYLLHDVWLGYFLILNFAVLFRN